MKSLIIDRYEGQYTICEDKDRNLFAIETSEMPGGAVPGVTINIADSGEITVDADETQKRKNRIAAKQEWLMKE